jgi:hypothetical protein
LVEGGVEIEGCKELYRNRHEGVTAGFKGLASHEAIFTQVINAIDTEGMRIQSEARA